MKKTLFALTLILAALASTDLQAWWGSRRAYYGYPYQSYSVGYPYYGGYYGNPYYGYGYGSGVSVGVGPFGFNFGF
ncbi:hypothetical protein A3F66_00635 [candidate division TM6 bacterium RIFCSPHIGHO2_12_FULL_32_22]|nr:MAG: hypothetical protein A3F66_00635 [candidate division TM6 bacterium RIFCSPHIGHO2_12_FULL_32_22]